MLTKTFLSAICLCLSLSSAFSQEVAEPYIFFLHNRFLENHPLSEAHPQYGKVEYREILAEFEKGGFTTISAIRKGNVNAQVYAQKALHQIDSLIQLGVKAHEITVIGTSKGGYIAQYVSHLAQNPELNFVFIASFRQSDLQNIPDLSICGRILNIYEASDPFGESMQPRINTATCEISHFRDLELNTGLKHGFLFKALAAWLEPCKEWAKGNYKFK